MNCLRAALLCFVVCLLGCNASGPRHLVETAVDRRLLERALAGVEPAPAFVEGMPPSRPALRPWAGTVSHHLLVAPLIDSWYAALARQGPYRLFIILSPKHNPQGRQDIALSDRDWEAGDGVVRAEGVIVRRLARRLGNPLEHQAFYQEHGIGAQIPFIRKHFPGSRIVAIVLEERYRRSDNLVRLADALEAILRNRRDAFLILSTDFTHHADQAKLDLCDTRTFAYFRAVSSANAPLAGCDSRAGILVLSLLAERLQRQQAIILAQTDSGRITGIRQDMTSYFFTLLY